MGNRTKQFFVTYIWTAVVAYQPHIHAFNSSLELGVVMSQNKNIRASGHVDFYTHLLFTQSSISC